MRNDKNLGVIFKECAFYCVSYVLVGVAIDDIGMSYADCMNAFYNVFGKYLGGDSVYVSLVGCGIQFFNELFCLACAWGGFCYVNNLWLTWVQSVSLR